MACSKSPVDPSGTALPSTIVLTVPSELLEEDAPVQAHAEVSREGDPPVDIRQAKCTPSWTSSSSHVASINEIGLIQPHTAGVTSIAVECGGLRAGASLRVARRTFVITARLHESPPTAHVLVPDARADITGGEFDSQRFMSDGTGNIVFPAVGRELFVVHFGKAGYEDVRVDVDPARDSQLDIALFPTFETVEDEWSTLTRWGSYGRELTFSFPAHHIGTMSINARLCVDGYNASEFAATCTEVRDDTGRLIAEHQGSYDFSVVTSISVPGGHRYDLTVSIWDAWQLLHPNDEIIAYDVRVSHPN